MKFLGIKVPYILGDLILRLLDCIVTISLGDILYCGCFNLFCNVWVWVCVGVLVICMLVFTVFCIFFFCVVCIVSFTYIYSYLFCLHYCKDYYHRVKTQLE